MGTLHATVTVDAADLREWAGRHADAGHHGVAHALFKAAEGIESVPEQHERELREQIARDIESGLPEARRRREDWVQRQQPDRVLGYTAAIDAIETCAGIARGEQP